MRQTLTVTVRGIAAVCSYSKFNQHFLPALTLADNMFLRSRFRGLGKGQLEGNKFWCLQLEGDLDQMVASLLQMHFTFPYLPLAHSRTVTDMALSQPLCVWRWKWDLQWALIQPGRSNTPTIPLSFSSTQMLQLCTAPTDENLILGYWPQTSHPLLMVPIGEGKIQPRDGLILRVDS